ncbi:MAG: class I SAM-dependent methyltransferase [Acetobacteraceae bacterium]|nr:class I SAM-dependent methyltransferase [Acetobacteraceae bacterium]
MDDKLARYAHNQRTQYDATSATLEQAQAQVAPDYAELRRIADGYSRFILQHYFQRRGWKADPDQADLSRLRVLDFGCGVGRVMEAFAARGVGQVDGCDISEAMLGHARANPALAASRLHLTQGDDAGGVAAGSYDIAYSFLCLHHIPMRQTRINILRALANALAPEGMVFVELKLFPGATPAKIPARHAHWSENMVATHTNSASDVWVTPDALGMVYEDVRLFFFDIAMIEFDLATNHYDPDPHAIYSLGFNELFVAGTRRPLLKALVTA